MTDEYVLNCWVDFMIAMFMLDTAGIISSCSVGVCDTAVRID
jgi:hypothetical protein